MNENFRKTVPDGIENFYFAWHFSEYIFHSTFSWNVRFWSRQTPRYLNVSVRWAIDLIFDNQLGIYVIIVLLVVWRRCILFCQRSKSVGCVQCESSKKPRILSMFSSSEYTADSNVFTWGKDRDIIGIIAKLFISDQHMCTKCSRKCRNEKVSKLYPAEHNNNIGSKLWGATKKYHFNDSESEDTILTLILRCCQN